MSFSLDISFRLVFISLIDDDRMKRKQAHLEFALRVVNLEPARSHRRELKTSFPVKGAQGWGERRLLENRSLGELGFLVDDALTIEVRLSHWHCILIVIIEL